MRLENKVTIITGAGSGIGRACSLLMAGEGAKVIASDVVAECAEETAKKRRSENPRILYQTQGEEDYEKKILFDLLDIMVTNKMGKKRGN